MKSKDELLPSECITAVQEQLIGFLNNDGVNEKGDFYYDGSTINAEPESEDSI